jgi:hypothetical protein
MDPKHFTLEDQGKDKKITYNNTEVEIILTIPSNPNGGGTQLIKLDEVKSLKGETPKEWHTLVELLNYLSDQDLILRENTIMINDVSLSVGTLKKFIKYKRRGPIDQNEVNALEQQSKTARNLLTQKLNGSGQRNYRNVLGTRGGSKKYKSRKVYKSRRSKSYRHARTRTYRYAYRK